MERLTYWNEEYGCWSYRCPSGDAAKRLAAYEDTGLEPKQIRNLTAVACARSSNPIKERLELAAYRALGPVEELSALVKARDEGRVVVLQGDYTEADGEEALRTAMYHCGTTNNPVTRYTADAIAEKLTRAEAEAALSGGKGNV